MFSRFQSILLLIVSWTILTGTSSGQALPRLPRDRDTRGRDYPIPPRPLPIQAARITQVVRNSPAERARLSTGQVILSVNGRRVTGIEDLNLTLRGTRRVRLEVATLNGRFIGQPSFVEVRPQGARMGLYAEMTTVYRTFTGPLLDSNSKKPGAPRTGTRNPQR